MQFLPALDDHVATVARGMRAGDAREFLAASGAETQHDLVLALVDRFGGHPAAIAALDDEGPVAIGAPVMVRPNVVTLLFFANDRFAGSVLPLTRFIVKNLFPKLRAEGVHRIDAASIEGHDEAHRWIRTLGLEHEAVLRGFGRGGEDFHQFAWVADHVRSPGA